MLKVGDRSVSQEQRRLRDRLSDDRNAQDLFNGLLENVTTEELTSLLLTLTPLLLTSKSVAYFDFSSFHFAIRAGHSDYLARDWR
jgi:hypothetical protein